METLRASRGSRAEQSQKHNRVPRQHRQILSQILFNRNQL
jgi:hypothetical protein